ncbi:hypothetical protein [Microbacterium paraoxydans]|uniref:hypothetical protein n=1 Tax=Microbacterium paraoxydans TaxID=199592 RepID=UPI00301336F1
MGTELRHLMASAVEAARLHAGVSFIDLSEQAGIAPSTLADLLEERADFTMEDGADRVGPGRPRHAAASLRALSCRPPAPRTGVAR